jgi:hypothetical protein
MVLELRSSAAFVAAQTNIVRSAMLRRSHNGFGAAKQRRLTIMLAGIPPAGFLFAGL